MIPEGWKETELGKVSICLDNRRIPLKESDREKRIGPYPYCGANGILGHIDDYLFDEDIILLAEDGGNYEDFASRPIAYRMTGKCWVNNHAHVVVAADGVDQGYLFHSLKHKDIRSLLASSTRAKLNRSELVKIPVVLPPLVEQRAIAEALTDADSLVESLDVLIAKKRDMKQAAMQQLLTGRTRLPGFSDDWREYKVGDFTDCRAGGTPSTEVPEYWGGPIRWMSSGELNYRRVSEVSGRITDLGLANSSAQMFPSMSVLIGLAGQGRTRGTSAINLVPLSTNQSIAAIFPSASHDSRFLYYVMDTKYDELRGLSDGGGGRGGLNLSIIRSVSVRMPVLDEQMKIADVLWDMDAEIDALVAQREKAELVKQGMMQELLSGRVRLA